MSETIEFKYLSPTDLGDMMAIERQSEYVPAPASTMRDSLLAAHHQVWGICLGSSAKLIGFGILSVLMDEAEIILMSIDPVYRRLGYGEKLLLFLIDKAKESKAEFLTLEVRSSNQSAIYLYEKFYFEKVGTRNKYFPCRGSDLYEDAVLFRLNLL